MRVWLWNQRVGLITIDKERSNRSEEEHVHQIHAERQLRDAGDPGRSLFLFDAGKEEESTEGGEKHIRSAELP